MIHVPTGWEKTCLGELASKIGSGATPKGGSKAYQPSGVPLIRSMNVHFDGFRLDGLAFLDSDQARKLDSVRVEGADVLLNITGSSIGRVTVSPDSMIGARVNQHVAIIRTVEEVEPQFVAKFMASPQAQQKIGGELRGDAPSAH